MMRRPAQATYAAGEGLLARVWEARRAVLAAEMEHLERSTEVARIAIELQYFTGPEGI